MRSDHRGSTAPHLTSPLRAGRGEFGLEANLQAFSLAANNRPIMTPTIHEAKTISVAIGRNWREVYQAVWRPEVFSRWASGLSRAGLARDGDIWKAQGPEGPITIRFTDHNAFGIMDHYVDSGTGAVIYIPLRIIANGDGALVSLTLFRLPGMSDEKFAEDAAWVQHDLAALKALVTS